LTLGIEGFGAMIAHSQGETVAAELAGELRAARTYATRRRQRVRVIADSEHRTIRTELADQPNAFIRELSYGDRGVLVEGLSDGSAVVFYSSGRVASPTTITIQNRRGERWQLTVTITGRVTIQ
jgi:Tfp pilus assembly protein FimT